MGGIKRVDKEVDVWQDTTEVLNNPRLMNKIKEVRSRIAKSS